MNSNGRFYYAIKTLIISEKGGLENVSEVHESVGCDGFWIVCARKNEWEKKKSFQWINDLFASVYGVTRWKYTLKIAQTTGHINFR